MRRALLGAPFLYRRVDWPKYVTKRSFLKTPTGLFFAQAIFPSIPMEICAYRTLSRAIVHSTNEMCGRRTLQCAVQLVSRCAIRPMARTAVRSDFASQFLSAIEIASLRRLCNDRHGRH